MQVEKMRIGYLLLYLVIIIAFYLMKVKKGESINAIYFN